MKTKKTVYIAHPLSGNLEGNAAEVRKICREVHTETTIPVATYLVTLQYLDDTKEEERNLGIDADLETFRRRYIDELWLYGNHISTGMKQEVKLALSLGIPVIPKTEGTRKEFEEIK